MNTEITEQERLEALDRIAQRERHILKMKDWEGVERDVLLTVSYDPDEEYIRYSCCINSNCTRDIVDGPRNGVLTCTLTPVDRPELACCTKIPFNTFAEALAYATGLGCKELNGKRIYGHGFPNPFLGLR